MKRISIAGAAWAALLLSACSGSEEPAPPPEANLVEALPEKAAPPPPAPLPPAPEPAVPAVDPAPTVDPDQQVLDDADASGMTSRVDRDSGAQEQRDSGELR